MRLFNILAIVFFVLSFIFLVISVYQFKKNDIRHVYLEYSGKATSEEIRAMRDKRQKDSNNRVAARIYDEQKNVKFPTSMRVERNLTDEIETVVLEEKLSDLLNLDATMLLVDELPQIAEVSTDVLSSSENDKTTVLSESRDESFSTVHLDDVDEDQTTQPADEMTTMLEANIETSMLSDITESLNNTMAAIEDNKNAVGEFVVLDELLYVHTNETI